VALPSPASGWSIPCKCGSSSYPSRNVVFSALHPYILNAIYACSNIIMPPSLVSVVATRDCYIGLSAYLSPSYFPVVDVGN
jgi:hypothetical protein